jgi:hypothetical protein
MDRRSAALNDEIRNGLGGIPPKNFDKLLEKA